MVARRSFLFNLNFGDFLDFKETLAEFLLFLFSRREGKINNSQILLFLQGEFAESYSLMKSNFLDIAQDIFGVFGLEIVAVNRFFEVLSFNLPEYNQGQDDNSCEYDGGNVIPCSDN